MGFLSLNLPGPLGTPQVPQYRVVFPPVFSTIGELPARQLLTACGGRAWESRILFAPGVASTPGMPKGATPVFWQSELAFMDAMQVYGLNTSQFPQALWTAVVNGLVVGRLVNPGPLLYIALNDLAALTIGDLVTRIRAIL